MATPRLLSRLTCRTSVTLITNAGLSGAQCSHTGAAFQLAYGPLCRHGCCGMFGISRPKAGYVLLFLQNMLRSKQLLPFAKGARAWIVGGTVTKSNTLDSSKSTVTDSEDGTLEHGFTTSSHGHGSNSHQLVHRIEEPAVSVARSVDPPLSATSFKRIHQQGSSSTYTTAAVLPRNPGVNAAKIPSRNVGFLLSSAAGNHQIAEKARKGANVDIERTAVVERTEVTHAEASGIYDSHEVQRTAASPKNVSWDASGGSAVRTDGPGVYPSLRGKIVENSASFGGDQIGNSHTAVPGGIGDALLHEGSADRVPGALVCPLRDSRKPSRQAHGSVKDHTIFFGTLDAPVVVPHGRPDDEAIFSERTCLEGPVVKGAQQEADRQVGLNPKSISPDGTGGPKQRVFNTKDSVPKGDLNLGFVGSRRTLGSIGHSRSTAHWSRSRREPGYETTSNEIVEQVSSILRRLGWTSETVTALAEYHSKLGAYHINEVLKHQREPLLAWEFFNWAKTQRGYKHDVRTYTTMIGILGRVGDFDTCSMLLENMRKEGCEPSVVTFNRLIHSYGRANNLNEALRIFQHMQDVGCQPDRVTYCTLIDLHSKSGLHVIAMEICEEMWRAGFQPDTFSYTLIIHCLGKAGNLSAANKLFSQMIDRGCPPNLVTYNIMIDMHAKAGKHHMALKLYNDMQDAGHRPDKVTYNVIMEVLGHSGNPDEAEEVFYEMVREGWTGDSLTFGLLVNMWGLAGNVEKAREWYTKMLDTGLMPNAPTSTSLLGAYLRARQYEGAMHVLQSLSKWGLTPTLPTYTLLLDSCTTCDRREDIDSVLHLMRSTGHPAHFFLCQVVDANVYQSKAHIQHFFRSLRLEDQETKRGFADALIEFLCRSEHKAKAGHVWEVAVENNLYPLAISQKEPNNWILDLHVMSKGTAVVALCRTLANLRERMLSTGVVPDKIEIVTGWGKHSRVSGLSLVKNAVQNMLGALGSPFYIDSANAGCFVGAGQPLSDWLHQSDMDHKLAL
ncbi:hypothetical protein R1sor_014196 [Riccia sorocarpa]|uniref:Smr domain-containing protein n=1 Tax=Riccia sorocarpa TaxID=122646 RepID=A0ABD3H8P8_9MARC